MLLYTQEIKINDFFVFKLKTKTTFQLVGNQWLFPTYVGSWTKILKIDGSKPIEFVDHSYLRCIFFLFFFYIHFRSSSHTVLQHKSMCTLILWRLRQKILHKKNSYSQENTCLPAENRPGPAGPGGPEEPSQSEVALNPRISLLWINSSQQTSKQKKFHLAIKFYQPTYLFNQNEIGCVEAVAVLSFIYLEALVPLSTKHYSTLRYIFYHRQYSTTILSIHVISQLLNLYFTDPRSGAFKFETIFMSHKGDFPSQHFKNELSNNRLSLHQTWNIHHIMDT